MIKYRLLPRGVHSARTRSLNVSFGLTDVPAIYWYTGFEASDPDKLPLVEVYSLKVIDQDFFWVLEMYFSDSVPKGFIILLAGKYLFLAQTGSENLRFAIQQPLALLYFMHGLLVL